MKLSAAVGGTCAVWFAFATTTDVWSAPYDAQIEQLVAELHAEPARRPGIAIANELATCGARALPALQSLLSSPNPRIRSYVILALGEMGSEAAPAVPQLLRIGEDPADEFQMTAISTLGRIGPVSADVAALLVRLARDKDPSTARMACQSLRHIGATSLPDVLRLLPRLPAERQGWFSAYLGKHAAESPEAIKTLDQQLTNGNQQLSSGAAFALSSTPVGCQHLLTRLDAPQAWLRQVVVVALGHSQSSAAAHVTQLSRALDDADATVRYVTLKAVESIGAYPPEVLTRVLAKLDDEDDDVRWRAVRIVGQMDNPQPELTPLIEAKLGDREPLVQVAAAVALFRLTGNSQASLATLEPLASHQSSTVRRACHEALDAIRSP